MFFVRSYCDVLLLLSCYCCRSHPNLVDGFPSIGIVRLTDRNGFDDDDDDDADADDTDVISDRFVEFHEISMVVHRSHRSASFQFGYLNGWQCFSL